MALVHEKPWWELSSELAAHAIIEIEEQHARTTSWRRQLARRLAGMYRGRNTDTPFARDAAFSWFTDPNNSSDVDADVDEVRLIRNKAFEYVETVVGKFSEEEAQPALMVTDGDYELKRKVTLNARLLEAEYDQRQGTFENLHALCRHGLRLAWSTTGTVAAKVYPWPKEDRVVVELHDTLDMFLDDTELTYANPRTFGEVCWWPVHRLCASYPKHAAAIRAALETPKNRAGLAYTGAGATLTELVPVWEAWAVRQGGEPGRHLVCLRSGVVLLDEEWELAEPPFAFFHASPALEGFWATPPVALVYDEICKVNEILSTCDFAHTHSSKQVHYVHEESVHDLGDLETVATVKVVRTKSPNYQPFVSNPQPFPRIDLDLLAEHERGIARTLGIDEMHSAARAEPGLPSAVAQREAASRFDDRHAALHRAFTQWVAVDLGRHVLRAQRKLYESNRAFKRQWTGELLEKEISAKDILDLDVEALRVRVKPVSELKNTPEERVQYAQELAEQGAIPFEAYMAVLEHYDTPGETRVIKTQRRWVAWQIDEWLMSASDQPVQYQSPRPWMRKSDALVQVVDALMEAELNGAPPERLQYFLDFVAELTTMMAAEVAPPAAPQAPLGFGQPVQGAAGMNAGAQGLMAPGLGGGLAQPVPAPAPGALPV